MTKVASTIKKRMKTVSIAHCSPRKTRKQKIERDPTPSKKKKVGHNSVIHNTSLVPISRSSDDESLPDLDFPASDRINPSQRTPDVTDDTPTLNLNLDTDEIGAATWFERMDEALLQVDQMSHDMLKISCNPMWKRKELCEECTVRDSMAGMSSAFSLALDLFGTYLRELRSMKTKLEMAPTNVSLDFFINSISSIDEVNMEYSMSIFMRQSWVDQRLAFTDVNETLTLSYNQINKLWVPDLFFKNEKKAEFHDITVPNRLITISPKGEIYYSQRVSLTLGCDMDLQSYPMDNQTCKIEIESYGYTTKDLVFIWKDTEEPVQVTENLQLPEFVLDRENIELGDCTSGYITGAFSCRFAQFIFIRQLRYYLIQVYIPTILIVVLSWVSFFIDIHAVPARISLGLLTVLTMTTQSSGISSRLPKVSYIKAIDIWMTACLAFVFGALVEYSIVNVLARKEKNRQALAKSEKANAKLSKELARAKAQIADPGNVEVAVLGDNNSSGELRKRNGQSATLEITRVPSDNETEAEEKKQSWCHKVCNNKALLVDVVSRFLFPMVFLVFNVAYWITYYTPQ